MVADPNSGDRAVGIVGLGTMGRGIAEVAANAGLRVLLYDTQPGAAAAARDAVASALAGNGIRARLEAVSSLAALACCDIVIEAIPENLELKRALFEALEAVVAPSCILASNTSSLTITSIASGCRYPSRVAGAHFSNPVPVKRIVEVVDGLLTDRATGDRLMAFAQCMGVRALRVRDTPGFVVNHNHRGFALEALRILAEGTAEFYEIDRIMCEAAGFRMGPFAMMDAGGLDVVQAVNESIYTQYFHEPRFRPSFVPRQYVDAGLLGRKTGRGFYRYDGDKARGEPVRCNSSLKPASVWVSTEHPKRAALVASLVSALGAECEASARPSDEALCIVTPLGHDTTTSALEQKLDPHRTVAIDTLFGLGGRRTIMTNPVTDAVFREGAHALLGSDGVPVSVIRDSPGFVAQRIVAMVVNVACHAAQQGIASPIDVDRSYGQAYAKGPLSLGDELGPRTMLTILENMHSFYGDPVYRPSPWLKRRALLGISLLTPDQDASAS